MLMVENGGKRAKKRKRREEKAHNEETFVAIICTISQHNSLAIKFQMVR